jgi:hypothetical protein
MKVLLAIIIAGFLGFKGYGIITKKDYSKPWWTGTELVYACKTPYYNISSCYKLRVTSNGEEITRLDFNNGGYFIIDNSECVEAAKDLYNYDQFCSFFEEDGTRWDVLPSHANY